MRHVVGKTLTEDISLSAGMSSYVPSWVKQNIRRFPRMQLRDKDGATRHTRVISNLSEECLEADRKAFSRLMEHVRETDTERTVIAMQVQNEVGILGGARDISPTAEEAFGAEVPTQLVQFLSTEWENLSSDFTRHYPVFTAWCQTRTNSSSINGHGVPKGEGSWAELFGTSAYTDELFMAYHYATYVEKIAVAGRQAYDIPLFTNAWLPKPGTSDASGNVASGGGMPGEYPSGGPHPKMLDVWRHLTPTLDFISPDIYDADYTQICRWYSENGQPFLIPEQRRDEYGLRRIWEAVGRFGALAAVPFGVDTLQAETAGITSHYELLSFVAPQLLQARREGRFVTGFFFDELLAGESAGEPIVRLSTSYQLSISRAFVVGTPGPGFGLIMELEEDRFLLVGKGFKVEFASRSPKSVVSGILRFEEKSVVRMGKEGSSLQHNSVREHAATMLRTDRSFNGDETRSGAWANMPNDMPHYGSAFIPIAIPARTGIAEVRAYSVGEEDGA